MKLLLEAGSHSQLVGSHFLQIEFLGEQDRQFHLSTHSWHEYQTDGYFRYITYLDKSIGLEFPFDEVISNYKEKQAPSLRD